MFQLFFVNNTTKKIRHRVTDVTQITLISRHEVRFHKKNGRRDRVTFLPDEYLEVKKA